MAFENLNAALRQVGGLVVSRLVQGIQENASSASGELEKSVGFNIVNKRNLIAVNIEMLDYWVYVDEGRKAGRMPPISKIQEWLTYPNVKTKIAGRDDANLESLAYSIAKKIGEKGTEGTDFATNVFESRLVQKEVPQLIEDSVGQDIEELLDKAFNIQ